MDKIVFRRVPIDKNEKFYYEVITVIDTKKEDLQLYSGKEDKNNIHIFDGDRLSFIVGKDKFSGPVVFKEGSFLVEAQELKSPHRIIIFNLWKLCSANNSVEILPSKSKE